MKLYVAILCAVASIALARPEPPVNQYLPSAGNYATTREDSFAPPPAALSSTYGAPASAYSSPSTTYGAPASAYSSPSSTYGAPASTYSSPSSTYGAPASAYSSPSSTYGAPASAYSSPSSTYGAPAAASRSTSSFSRGSSKSFSRAGGLSRSYGAPAVARTNAIFGSALASTYGAPAAQYAAPSPVYGVPGYARYNPAEDDLSEPANYQFSYRVQDAESGSEFGHLESRQGDAAWGSYNVLLPDGRKQIVEYEADQAGFRPMIRYEEPLAGYGRGAGGPY
ncbi:pro-resilin-like [Bacillus rossius redtenbacheri]|uniref:pro-resilin-like n=1 Tax=Bacillus rossius redtenbacheri TaxID=93214 RepID=UPI002FDD9DE5